MHQQLVREHSLYLIDEKELHYFKHIASQYKMNEHLPRKSSLHENDDWPTFFNIWCLFYEKEKRLILDYSKMIVHGCNFYCLDLLRKTKELQHFFIAHGKNDRTVFLLSYYVGRELLYWTYNLLAQSEEGLQLMEKNYKRDYFLLMTNGGSLEDEKHEHYADQKLMTSLLAQSYSTDDAYKNHIETAIQQTREYLRILNVLPITE